MKTIKVSPRVHTELKSFVAKNSEWTMDVFASQAILSFLRTFHHKFVFPKDKFPVKKSPKLKSPNPLK